MSGTNDFLPFATASGANVYSASDWSARPERGTGFQSGTAASKSVSTPIRQASFTAAAISQAIADILSVHVADDGVVGNYETQFLNFLAQVAHNTIPEASDAEVEAASVTGKFVSPAKLAGMINNSGVPRSALITLIDSLIPSPPTVPTFASDAEVIAENDSKIMTAKKFVDGIADTAGTSAFRDGILTALRTYLIGRNEIQPGASLGEWNFTPTYSTLYTFPLTSFTAPVNGIVFALSYFTTNGSLIPTGYFSSGPTGPTYAGTPVPGGPTSTVPSGTFGGSGTSGLSGGHSPSDFVGGSGMTHSCALNGSGQTASSVLLSSLEVSAQLMSQGDSMTVSALLGSPSPGSPSSPYPAFPPCTVKVAYVFLPKK